ncbi:MAG: hypothetical protein AB7J28_15910 [Hyphomonadaceae bacterium]
MTDLSLLTVEARRELWRKAYMLELGRSHALGKCRWPIERLGEIVDKSTQAFIDGNAALGEAAAKAARMMGIKRPTLKAIRALLT